MKIQIYYFSATGNSLAMARRIGGELGETELLSIPKLLSNESINPDASVVGFVFPVYAYGPPRIVEEFMGRIQLSKDQYVFAVATAGGTVGDTLVKMKKLCRKSGADLNAGFIASDDGHSPLTVSNPIIRFMKNIAGPRPKLGVQRLPEIVDAIRNRRRMRPETNTRRASFFGSILHGFAIKSFKNADKGFWTDDQCNGCGICARTCPRNNIRIENGKPIWRHDCESCYGCLQWCPQKAIQYGQDTVGGARSHNRDVQVGDVILR